MNERISHYKSLSLQTRIDMSLSENIGPPDRLLLAQDQWNVIRCYFSRRADLTAEEIAILIKDDDYVIRLSIAKRDDLTPEQVEACVNDADPNVRHAIARSTLLSKFQRDTLKSDEDDLVRRSADKGPRPVQFRQREGQTKLIK